MMNTQLIRYSLILLVMFLIAFSVLARMVHVHVLQADELKREGERHYKRNIPSIAYRGNVLDRNGKELAVSAPSVSLWMDPSDINIHTVNLDHLAGYLGEDVHKLKRRIEKNSGKQFMYLRRQVSPNIIEKIKADKYDFVEINNEQKRVYPEGSVFSHVVGITDVDGQGVEGIELVFNKHLNGQDGVKSVLRDRLGRSFEIVEQKADKFDGQDVVLSLDRNIQYIAHSELRSAIKHHAAGSGMLIILDVKKAKVLSMVNYPSYNPNERSSIHAEATRNRSIIDMIEPGSTIKPFIIAAGMESGALDQDDVFDVSSGYINIADKKINDTRNYGRLDVSGVLLHSSNVGIIKISERIEDKLLAEKLRDYGLFSPTGIELPGDSDGLFRPQSQWNPTYKPFLSFGYGAALSALQIANAYLILANHGVRRDLSILDDTDLAKGVRVMHMDVAKSILHMLEGVVGDHGTARQAAVPAWRVSGKTGTAKKLINGKYANDRYVSVFSGVAPVNNPEIVVVVIIDDPRKNGFYGGVVAGPVFSKVVSRVLRYLDVSPDKHIKLAAYNAG